MQNAPEGRDAREQAELVADGGSSRGRGRRGEVRDDEGPHRVRRRREGLAEDVHPELRGEAVRSRCGEERPLQALLDGRGVLPRLEERLGVEHRHLGLPRASPGARGADAVGDCAREVRLADRRDDDVDRRHHLTLHLHEQLVRRLGIGGLLLRNGGVRRFVELQDRARFLEGLDHGLVGRPLALHLRRGRLFVQVLVAALELLGDELGIAGQVDDELRRAEKLHELAGELLAGDVPVEDDQRVAAAVGVLLQLRQRLRRSLLRSHRGHGHGGAGAEARGDPFRQQRREFGRQAVDHDELRHRRLVDEGRQGLLLRRLGHLHTVHLPEAAEVSHDLHQPLLLVRELLRGPVGVTVLAAADVLLPPRGDGLVVPADVEDLVDAELRGQLLDLIRVDRAVLDDQVVRASQIDDVLQQLDGHGQRDDLALGQHAVHL
mmetsp:Transcript_41856/g.83250  ORF Transcript_41856/g.83250 Transcript_41856/m.83250 type:complete len:434 (+) Transcript_41856:420-1721(+)